MASNQDQQTTSGQEPVAGASPSAKAAPSLDFRKGRCPENHVSRTIPPPEELEAVALANINTNTNHTIRSSSELEPPPDGGLKAWTQVAMGWITIFATWGYINSFGSFQAYYVSALPQTPSQISWIGSVQAWLTFLVSAFSGRALDAGFFLSTFLAGATIQLLGIFLMSISTSYWHLMLTQGVLTGLGGGILFTPSLAVVTTYFQKRRGIAVGFVTTGNSLGGVVYPLVVRGLLPKVGFGWAARVLGFINLSGFCLVAIFMRPRLPPRKTGPVIDWTAFKDPLYMSYVGGMFFFVWAVYYTFYYLGSFGRERLGLSYGEASILITILNGVGLPMRAAVPFLADRFGPLNVIAPTAFCVAIVAFSWLAVKNVVGIYVFTVFYGLASGAFQCLMPTGVASITKRLDTVGTRLGMCFSIISFAGLTGPPVGGALQSATGGDYKGAHIWAAMSSLLCCVLLAVARVLKGGWNPDVKC